MDVKEPKTIEEQIEYLKEDKRVVFNDISEEDARIILEKYGYINVISPFKYHFAKKEKGRIIKIGNKHCYERNVDFNEYTEKYQSERLIYPTLYESISKFEVTFNAVVSHHIVNYYKINSEEAFDEFLTRLVPIRNCIYHNNSLEILYRYLNIEKKSLRTDSDKRKYKNIVKRLQETKKTT